LAADLHDQILAQSSKRALGSQSPVQPHCQGEASLQFALSNEIEQHFEVPEHEMKRIGKRHAEIVANTHIPLLAWQKDCRSSGAFHTDAFSYPPSVLPANKKHSVSVAALIIKAYCDSYVANHPLLEFFAVLASPCASVCIGEYRVELL